jgi:hypothetical protein
MVEYRKVKSASRNPGLIASAEQMMVALCDIPRVVRQVTAGYPTPKVTTRRTKGGGGWYRWQKQEVHFKSHDGFVRLHTILHECAHHIHFCSDPGMKMISTTADRKRYWHGPEFTRIVDRLVTEYFMNEETKVKKRITSQWAVGFDRKT